MTTNQMVFYIFITNIYLFSRQVQNLPIFIMFSTYIHYDHITHNDSIKRCYNNQQLMKYLCAIHEKPHQHYIPPTTHKRSYFCILITGDNFIIFMGTSYSGILLREEDPILFDYIIKCVTLCFV